MFKQSIPRIGLSMESGTEAAPEDGQYHLILQGRVVFSSASEKEAKVEYERRKRELLGNAPSQRPPSNVAEALRREIAAREATAFLGQSARQKRARAFKRGGRRGSGGVSG